MKVKRGRAKETKIDRGILTRKARSLVKHVAPLTCL